MADITPFTASAVVIDNSAKTRTYRAHAAINAGQPVYELATTYPDGVQLTDADALASSRVVGLAVSSAAAGQPVEVCYEGLVTCGSGFSTGRTLFISPTAGGLTITEADLLTADFPSIVGYFYSATQVYVKPMVYGVSKA